MTVTDPQAYGKHARELAAAFGVRLVEHPSIKPEEALAIPAHLRIVLSTPVIDETTYAVALHEIGHLVAPTGALPPDMGRSRGLTLVEEVAAWEWAQHYALEWTPLMERVKAYGLGTYTTTARPAPAPEPEPELPATRIDWSRYR